MERIQNDQQTYVCPMHPEVRQSNPGKCPQCGMALLPEGTRLALLRHMTKNPWMIAVMLLIMLGVMALIMHML